MPSIRTAPETTSRKRGTRPASVVFPAPLDPTSATTSPARISSETPFELHPAGRGIAETDVLEHDPVAELLELPGARLVLDFFRLIEIREHLLRRAQRLLKNVVQIRDPLHRLIKKQQRGQKAHERFRLRARDS